MRHVEYDQRVQRTHLADSEIPRHYRSPIMSDQNRFFCSGGINQSGHVVPELLQRILLNSQRTAGSSISTLIGRPRAIAQPRQHRQLPAPRERMFRKAMQAQSQPVTATAGGHFKSLPITADKLKADGLLRCWLGTHGQLILPL